MSEEVKDILQDPSAIGKLSAGEYWEWRCTIEELKSAKLNSKRSALERELLSKELKIKQLELKLHSSKEEVAHKEQVRAKQEYDRFKKLLEDKLEHSLNNCVIDDITFEVKSLKD